MIIYQVKTPAMLSEFEVTTILKHWEVDDWLNFTLKEFNERFADSEFHLLTDKDSNILCVTRINFDFHLELNHVVYRVSELVGLVSVEKMKGHAKRLISDVVLNLKNRGVECIGFCESGLRPFYEKCGTPVLYDQAHYLKEKPLSEEFDHHTDDDILDITLSAHLRNLLTGLNKENIGYILFED
ncbi:hypothetical protein HDE68_004385 [Pedobacter cryoconitis]|uniref:N-acetyltransferase domain-containing protein n=1 Tax=Pedobacter cryoconitis TaxID=188932 RepID=A0A7W8ZQR8_9SPHI|nr:hypothetical protein [Pedobacter cryoconitis]MBB5638456.1 hypothetical protein [Pedobacter cryoconitis]